MVRQYPGAYHLFHSPEPVISHLFSLCFPFPFPFPIPSPTIIPNPHLYLPCNQVLAIATSSGVATNVPTRVSLAKTHVYLVIKYYVVANKFPLNSFHYKNPPKLTQIYMSAIVKCLLKKPILLLFIFLRRLEMDTF